MVQLIRSGALRYANPDLVEEARLAGELAGDLIVGREGGQPEQQPVGSEERPSVAARQGPPQVELAPQRQEMQRYLQRMDPTDGNHVMGQNQPSGGPLTMHFRRNARSTDQANPDTTRDSADL